MPILNNAGQCDNCEKIYNLDELENFFGLYHRKRLQRTDYMFCSIACLAFFVDDMETDLSKDLSESPSYEQQN